MELDRKADFCAFSPQLQPGFSFVGVRRFIMLIRVRCVNQLLTAEPLWASAAQADAVPAKKTINGSGSLLRGETGTSEQGRQLAARFPHTRSLPS